MTELDLPPITLPAEFVIPAWRNAYLASGADDDQGGIYRSVHIEWHDNGLRFTATDGFVLVTTYASDDRWATSVAAPPRDAAPIGDVTAIAADRLMTDFLKHRAAEVKASQREDNPGPGPIDVTFSIGTIGEPDTPQQRLDLGEDHRRLIVSCDTERIALPLNDQPFPNWRGVLGGYKPTPRAKVAVRPDLLHRIGQLNSLPMTSEEHWLTLTMANGGSMVLVDGSGRVPIEGAFAPRRDEADDEHAAVAA